MSFLEDLKAQKGLGKKPPVVVDKPIVSWPIKPIKPHVRVELKPPLGHVVLADGNTIRCMDLADGTYVKCLNCSKVSAYPKHTQHHGRFCSSSTCVDMYPHKYRKVETVTVTTLPKETREGWLTEAIEKINKELFVPNGYGIPIVRVSVGFPAGSRPKTVSKTLGQYWPAGATSDGVPQIFISPSKSASGDAVEMLAVLVHEMVHAACPGKGHGPEFRRRAYAVGLNGPMRATTPKSWLIRKLVTIAASIGPFPHGTIDPTTRPGKKGKLRGYECSVCGFKFYTTQKWIDKVYVGEVQCPDNQCRSKMVYTPPKS